MMTPLAFDVRRGVKVNNALRKSRMKAGLIMTVLIDMKCDSRLWAELNGKNEVKFCALVGLGTKCR